MAEVSIYYTWKNKKSQTKIINWDYQKQHGMNNLNYLMDFILHQIFKLLLSTSSRRMKWWLMNQQNSKYVYIQNQNWIPSFKLLIPKSLKLLGSTVRRYLSGIISLQFCKQSISAYLRSVLHICTKLFIQSVTKYFPSNLYSFRYTPFSVFIN